MQELTLNIKEFDFNSKIKFYYSLLYISELDIRKMKKYFGDDLDVFNYETLDLPAIEYYPLKTYFERIKRIYNSITLSDEEILRLFHSNEITNCLKQFLKKRGNEFDYNNAEDLESFYSYLVLSKVENHTSYGYLNDFFKTCSFSEINDAIKSLDYKMSREFSKIFGDKNQEKVTFKVNHEAKNTILIKLYNHILLGRKNVDVVSIIKSLDQDATFKQMKLMDYIRNVRDDFSLTDEQIISFIKELDYQSRTFLKKVYGDNYNEIGVVYNPKKFNAVIKKINFIIDNDGKEVISTKRYVNHSLQSFLDENGISRQDFDKAFERLNNNQQKILKYYYGLDDVEKLTMDQIAEKEGKTRAAIYQTIKSAKQKIVKLIKTGKINVKRKEHTPREKDTLEKFLEENDITREEFDKALNLLNNNQRKLLKYYYGLDDVEKLTMDQIAEKENKTRAAIYQTIKKAKKRIVKLIKTGKINVKRKEHTTKEKDTLEKFLEKNDITREEFDKALSLLSDFQRKSIEYHFGLTEDKKQLSYKEIAVILDKKRSNVSNAITIGKKRILELIKTGQINGLKNKDNRKAIQESLEEFLEKNNISREDFDKAFNLLNANQKKLLKYYYGLDDVEKLTVDQIAEKEGKTYVAIYQAIKNAKKSIIKLIKTGKINVKRKEHTPREKDTLEKFLEENDITREEFDKALSLLSDFQRKSIEYHFGLTEDKKQLSYKEIAVILDKKRSNVSNAITIGKKRILELIKTGQINGLKNKDNRKAIQESLEEFLEKNNISREDFDKAFNLLNANQKKLLKYYYGLDDVEKLTVDQIAEKEGKTYVAIYQTIKNSKKRIINLIVSGKINENKKTCERRSKQETYEEFLKQNGITDEQFKGACSLITENRKKLLYLYFGIEKGSSPKSIKEIATLLKKSGNTVSQSISSAKKQVIQIIKSGKLQESINNEKFKELNNRLKVVYKELLKDDEFKNLVSHTSPLGATALSLITNFNFDLNELSLALVMDKENVVSLLMSVSTVALEHIKNPLYNGPIDYDDYNAQKGSAYKKEGNNPQG